MSIVNAKPCSYCGAAVSEDHRFSCEVWLDQQRAKSNRVITAVRIEARKTTETLRMLAVLYENEKAANKHLRALLERTRIAINCSEEEMPDRALEHDIETALKEIRP